MAGKRVHKALKERPLEGVKKVPVSRAKKVDKVALTKKKRVGTKLTAVLVKDETNVCVTICDNTKKDKSTALIPREKQALATLSPYRFPIPSERTIGIIARSFGVFFVSLGAILSLYNFSALSETVASLNIQKEYNYAQVLSGTDGTTLSTQNGVLDPSFNETVTPPALQIEESLPLRGNFSLTVTAYGAKSVKVLAEYERSGQYVSMGSLIEKNSGVWQTTFDSTRLKDGTYTFSIIVETQSGSREFKDGREYTVGNNIDDTSGELLEAEKDATGEDAETDSEEETLEAPPLETLVLEPFTKGVIEGEYLIKTEKTTATNLRAYARHEETGRLLFLGEMRPLSGGVWVRAWDTRTLQGGTYRVYVQGLIGTKTIESTRRIFEQDIAEKVVDEDESDDTSSDDELTLTPPIWLSPQETVQKGTKVVSISLKTALRVEFYLVPKGSLTPRYLGLGRMGTDGTTFTFVWDTTQTPNGEYELIARAQNVYGGVPEAKKKVSVENSVRETYSPEEERAISNVLDVNESLIQVVEDTERIGLTEDGLRLFIQTPKDFLETKEVSHDERDLLESTLGEFKPLIDVKYNELARQLRQGDEESRERIRKEVEEIRSELVERLESMVSDDVLRSEIDAYLSQVAQNLEERTVKNEKILRERSDESVFQDSDKDDISDYDEINLYQTDPFIADSDADGYVDSIEIRLGYNPHDPKNEANVRYESPKDAGIIRDDILAVETLTTLRGETEENPPQALISGRGLPQSFVTLYIFSTPLVVTVKTDERGEWTYVFDKELEDGEHEVYVGITDNTGTVVAKSNPFPFVKTATAYAESGAQESAPVMVTPSPSLIERNSLLTIASITVVALGLILMILGYYTGRRRELDPRIA